MKEMEYVVFNLADEKYGIDICGLSSIERNLNITRVPSLPSYVLGVFNLRGEIVPVVDLRQLFGVKLSDLSKDSRILVVKKEKLKLGLLVDYARDTGRFAEAEEQPEQFPEYVISLAEDGKQEIMVVSVDDVFETVANLNQQN
ncbi:MAG: hypothetical protein CSA13_00140 [Clostridiales bacterium]|nr:MAG: hypothetical protein CSA13_00140 [Clostridiales bacterium]